MEAQPRLQFAQAATMMMGPAVGDTVYASSMHGYSSRPVRRPKQEDDSDEADDDGNATDTPGTIRNTDGNSDTASPTTEPAKKRQKRNKPTLSCFECVERKTKASNLLIPRISSATVMASCFLWLAITQLHLGLDVA